MIVKACNFSTFKIILCGMYEEKCLLYRNNFRSAIILLFNRFHVKSLNSELLRSQWLSIEEPLCLWICS